MAKHQIEFNDYEIIKKLNFNEHEALKLIAKTFKIKIGSRGQIINLEGNKESITSASKLIAHLANMLKNNKNFNLEDIRNAALRMNEDPSLKAKDFLGESLLKTKGYKDVIPKGPAQQAYVDAIKEYDLVFGVGPAGTGKTYLAMTLAVVLLKAKTVSRIILTRPAVEAGEKLGFLPGNMEEKVSPYLRPLYDALFDLVGAKEAEELINHNVIEVAPLAFMRGRTLNNAFIILDEAQNTTVEQMKMALTRLGFGSKMVVTGDITQIDLPPKQKSGLIDALSILKKVDAVKICRLTEKDVLRHPVVKVIVKAYEYKNAN
jgi:phosphate starvation-inducible PhoH-like protein